MLIDDESLSGNTIRKHGLLRNYISRADVLRHFINIFFTFTRTYGCLRYLVTEYVNKISKNKSIGKKQA